MVRWGTTSSKAPPIDRELREGCLDGPGEADDGLCILEGEEDDVVAKPSGASARQVEPRHPGEDVGKGGMVCHGQLLGRLEGVGDGDVRRHTDLGGFVVAGTVGSHGDLGSGNRDQE